MLEALAPRNVKELQSFIGTINYYGKYIKNFASIGEALFKLLRKDTEWLWGKEQNKSFKTIKEKLSSAPVLMVYNQPYL